MRPTLVESFRGIQIALAEAIVPELSSIFAQDVAQTIQMLLESLTSEVDTAAENLHSDNEAIAGLLSRAIDAIAALPWRNDQLTALVIEIETALAGRNDDSLAISALTVQNDRLRSALERTLVVFEDMVDPPEIGPLAPVRTAIYAHLREVAVRGWSFWDISSFRERMAQVRPTPRG